MTSQAQAWKDADDLPRRELQQVLKSLNLPSSGTSAALRERYTKAKRDRGSTESSFSTPNNLGSSKCPSSPQSSDAAAITSSAPPRKKARARMTFNSPVPSASAEKASFSTPTKSVPIPAMDYSPPSSMSLSRRTTLAPKFRPKENLAPQLESKPDAHMAVAEEKRLRRFRSTCSASTRQRIERAKTQKLFLVKCGSIDDNLKCEFVVLGSTGNVYTVNVEQVPSCTCPDHAKGNLCKHILFVLLKVIALDPASDLIYQVAWTSSELQTMFEQMQQRFQQVTGSVLADAKVLETFAKLECGDVVEDGGVARKEVSKDDDCAICFDTMSMTEATTYCRARCGANFHKDCMEKWLKVNRKNPTCPMCRDVWQDESVNDFTNKEGFTNLGKFQGQSPERDTSTYSTWFQSPNKKRKRYF